VLALEQWPEHGIPDNPAAWLTATAKHRAIDAIRRERARDAKYAQLAAESDPAAARADSPDAVVDAPIGDDVLALIFVSCHPALPLKSRVALTLRLLGGLSTEEIAGVHAAAGHDRSADLPGAKRTLSEAQVPFAVPDTDELPARLTGVLEVVYLIFNEGYSATSGDSWIRRDLAEEAMRLGPTSGRAGAARGRGPRAGGSDGTAGRSVPGPSRCGRIDGAAAGPEPPPVGPTADPARTGGPGTGDRPPPAARSVRAPGRDRRTR